MLPRPFQILDFRTVNIALPVCRMFRCGPVVIDRFIKNHKASLTIIYVKKVFCVFFNMM